MWEMSIYKDCPQDTQLCNTAHWPFLLRSVGGTGAGVGGKKANKDQGQEEEDSASGLVVGFLSATSKT